MSDLISRSTVFEEMTWLFNNYVNNANNFEPEETEAISRAFDRLTSVINDIPTAYNVDEVVKRIECVRDSVRSTSFKNGCNAALIEITRKGGV